MNRSHTRLIAALTLLWAGNVWSQTIIPAQRLQEDARILRDAIWALHPGLTRYQNKQEVEAHFKTLQQELSGDRTLRQAYLALSRFAAALQCGHTYCNYWNQPESVVQELFEGTDKLPFAFQWVDRRMVISMDATVEGLLPAGTEIMAIDGRRIPEILEQLLLYTKGDGARDETRLFELQITGEGKYETFDIYYPLVFPPASETVQIEVQRPQDTSPQVLSVRWTTREVRAQRLKEREPSFAGSVDDLWRFELLDDRIAYLKLGSFVTWKMQRDWKEFLRQSFDTVAAEKVGSLILDIRGNAGGDSEVNNELAQYLVSREVVVPTWEQRLTYERIPPELSGYLETWDDSFRDRTDQVIQKSDGSYRWKNEGEAQISFWPREAATSAQVILLVNAANSSATFFLARTLKDAGLATLMGQATGGNLRGTNGSQIFFLRLPHSRIEVDLPVIGFYPRIEQPDAGLEPDIFVRTSIDDLRKGVDPVLEAALGYARQSQTKEKKD